MFQPCILIACLLPSALLAQSPSERAVFLVRHGSDTLAVETMTRTGSHADAVLLVRSPVARLHQEVDLRDSAIVSRLTLSALAGARGDSVRGRTELTFQRDTVIVHVSTPGIAATPDRRAAVPHGIIPFVNISSLSLELILQRARAIGGDSVRIDVMPLGGQSLQGSVVRVGADSAVITLGGIPLRARLDARGRLLGAVVPSQGVVFERLPGDSPAAAWTPARVSYAAPAGAPYTARDITVRTPAGLTLAGTITIPRHSPGARVPAVLLITGSGAQDRDEGSPFLEKWRPFAELADTLTRRGIAVLRLDDRGVGGSDAGPLNATSSDLAGDVRTAVTWLRALPEVDPSRVGLVGHSEGGIIAPMVAADDPRLRAIVLIAGTASRGRDILEAQRRYLFMRDTTMRTARRDSLMKLADRQADSAYRVPGWMHFFADYDPLPAARRVKIPVLILQGETDRQVPVAEAHRLADAIRTAGNRRVTLRTFPRMNHLMVDDPSGNPLAYPSLPSLRVRKDLLGVLADWLAQTL